MNPYEPPASEIGQVGSPRGFYSVAQITAAAFVGGPYAACIMIANNYARVGRMDLRTRWLVWGMAGTVVLIAAAFDLPENITSALPIGYTIGFFDAAKRLQRTDWAAHSAAGARNQSWWKALGLSLLVFLSMMGIILAVSLFLAEH
jgi:hypothetical protein